MADFALSAIFGIDATGAKAELRQLTRETRGFANTWAAISFAAAGTAIVALAKGAVDLAASLKDAASALGIDIQALQALNYVAEQNGSSQAEMQKALEKTRLYLQKASAGGAEQVATLQKLNLHAEKLAALPLERKFEALAKAYAEAQDKASAYNAVSEIFGDKVGPKMLATLSDLASQGFSGAARAASDAGHVMSSETVLALESASQAIENFKKQAIIAVGSIIVNFRTEEGLVLLSQQIRKAAQMFAAKIGDAIVEAYGMFEATFGAAGIWLRERTQNGLVSAIEAAAKVFNKVLPQGFKIDIAGIEKFRAASEDFSDILARTISETEPSRFTQTVGETWDKLIADQQRVVDSINNKDFGEEAKKITEAIDNAGTTLAQKVERALNSFFGDMDKKPTPKPIKQAAEEIITAGGKAGAEIKSGAKALEEAAIEFGRQMRMTFTTWVNMEKDTRVSILGARGASQFAGASDAALEEISRRNKQQALTLRAGGDLSDNYYNRQEAARLEYEAQNAQRELGLRKNVRRSFDLGGVEAVYRANPGMDPITLDRLVQQVAEQLPEAQRTANSLDRIERGLAQTGLIPRI